MTNVAGHSSLHPGRRGPGRAGSLEVGLRRIDWVRLLVGEHEVAAEAVGMGFRLPASRPIPLSLAAELIASGVPSVTRHVPPDGEDRGV
jgi:hypothetical protein